MNRLRAMKRSWTSFATRVPVLTGALLLTSLVATMAAGVGLVPPAWADPFVFSTGASDGLLGALSQPAGSEKFETETADDFVLTETTSIARATIVGLITAGAPLANIQNVEVEVYHVFPADSAAPSGRVPSRANSPSDVEIESATRDGSPGTLAFTASSLNPSFTVPNTVVNGINPKPGNLTLGDGAARGEVVQIDLTFNPPIVLPAGHYFFRPEVAVSGGDFLYLSAPKPVATDLQAWIRNSALAPDWLRIGTDIIGGSPVHLFNMTFSLAGETVPEAGTPGQANCHGESVAALAHQFGGLAAAASSLGFSSVSSLQRTFREFCGPNS